MAPAPLPPPDLLERFETFCQPILSAIGGRRTRRLCHGYTVGLLSPSERKAIAPIARLLSGREQAPSLWRDMASALAEEDWDWQQVMGRGGRQLLRQSDGWRALVIDDTALLKQGKMSVGVANQYAGCVGGLADCQVVVTVDVASEHVSAPLAAQLFLPECWDKDTHRRERCGVPAHVRHQPKWQVALELLRFALEEGAPRLPVLADGAYGSNAEFRAGLAELECTYMVAVNLDHTFWHASTTFVARERKGSIGRPATRLMAQGQERALDINALAAALPADAWQVVTWRDGSRGPQRGRFAAVRARPARGYISGGVKPEDLQPEQWLLIHWPVEAAEPTKAWLCNLGPEASLLELVSLARLRWRIERDYREEKGLVGLDHYEGRSWRGLHHHLALILVSHQFLAWERWRQLQKHPPLSAAELRKAGFPPGMPERVSRRRARRSEQAMAVGGDCCPEDRIERRCTAVS